MLNTSTSAMSVTQPSMLDAINSCSFIRVGNRIVYPGVNGNAFQFSDSPPVAGAQSMPDLSNIPEEAEDHLEVPYAGDASMTSSNQSLADPITPTPSTPEPAVRGLPPTLPPPPAAHLPPPLPSKPPTGIPVGGAAASCLSRRSSCSSRSSSPGLTRPSRPTERGEREQAGRAVPSADDDADGAADQSMEDEQDDPDSSLNSPTFYRSSGTLTVALSPARKASLSQSPSPSRSIGPPSPPQTSADGGPQAKSSGGGGGGGVRSSLVLSSAALMSATCSTPPASRKALNKSEEKPKRAGSEPSVFEGGGEQPGRPATPDSGIDCHLDAKGYDVVPLRAKQSPPDAQEEASPPGRRGNNSPTTTNNNNKLIPLDISASLRKGTMGVAELVTSVMINYKSKSRAGKDAGKTGAKAITHHEATDEEDEQPVAMATTTTTTTTPERPASVTPEPVAPPSGSDVETKASTHESAKASSFGTEARAEPMGYSAIGSLPRTTMSSSWHAQSEHQPEQESPNHLDSSPTRSSTATPPTTDLNGANAFRPIPGRLFPNSAEVSASDVSETESDASTASGGWSSAARRVRGQGKQSKASRSDRKTVKSIKNAQKLKPKLEKAPKCRTCSRQFGLRNLRHHCTRCRKSHCEHCLSLGRYRIDMDYPDESVLTRVCSGCREEIALEDARGQTRGLWTEYQQMRADARQNKGLDVTSKASNKEQTIHDLTPLLRKVCVTFLVELQQQLDRGRVKASHVAKMWDSTSSTKYSKVQKAKMKDVKDCSACRRQLRYLTDSRFCDVCGQIFCTVCTAKTLQLYLPVKTDVTKNLTVDSIKFHIKTEEKDEILAYEASETYFTCLDCENTAERFIKILSFNQNIPGLEAEMFDLQRHIDHALTYAPPHLLGGMRKAVSTSNLTGVDSEAVETNTKLAHRLYDRFTRAYDVLNHMEPQTAGQMLLHMHIKQAMYNFYLQRRDQLRVTLRRRGSYIQLPDVPPQ